MEYQDIQYARHGHVVTITLDRADARNAYSDAMVRSLVDALDEAELDDRARCVVLTGNGSSFHAGGDLKKMRDRTEMFDGDPVHLRTRYTLGIQRVPRRFERFTKPVVAAVNGPAIGAGLDLSCMCDLRIASERACFGSTFVRVGLVPGDGGAYFLPRVVGFPRALELMLTGRVIDADEALRIGLVHTVVPHEKLGEVAVEWAARMAKNAPLAVRLTKALSYGAWGQDLETALALSATYQAVAHNTEDHAEGVDAILSRRKPHFSGS